MPFFFKQWGGVRKSQAGRELDGRTYDAMPPPSPHLVADHSTRLNQLKRFELQLACGSA